LRGHLAVYVRAGPDDASRGEHEADSGLRVIAEQGAQELHSRIADAVRRPQGYGSIGVLEIAGSRSRSEVDPAPQVGVPHEAVMGLVCVSEHDARRHLSVHLAPLANGRSANTAAE